MLHLVFASLPLSAACKLSCKALLFALLSLPASNSAPSDGTERQHIAPSPKISLRQAGSQHIASAPMQDWGTPARCPAETSTPPQSKEERGPEAGQAGASCIGSQMRASREEPKKSKVVSGVCNVSPSQMVASREELKNEKEG